MKYYTLARKMPEENPTLLTIVNNPWTPLGQGHLLPEGFDEPVECELDPEFGLGEMATFYQARGVICTQALVDDLVSLGVDNIEVKKAIVRTADGEATFDHYVLLNILGRVAGADMDASDAQTLGAGIHVIDSLVFSKDAALGRKLFLVDEDTQCIVVNEPIYLALKDKYQDLYFEGVTLV